MPGVGDEEVPGRIERDAAGRVQNAGAQHGAHRRPPRPPRRRPGARPDHSGQRDEPGQGHGQSAHGHIMPVAAAAGTGDGP